MFFLHDISNFNKKEVKVKSYIRDGHLVKQSKRKIDIKDLVNKAGIGLGIGTGIGAAYLLGNRNGFNNSKKVISELENKLLKREPKIINRIINRVPKQDRHIGVEEIRDIIRSENQSLMGEVKQEISRVNNNTSKEIIREVIKEPIKPVINSDEWVDEITPVVKGTKLDILKIDNLDELISSSYLKDVPNKNLDKLSIEELENNISKLDKEQKYIRSYLDKNDIADTLENLTNTVNKEGNSDKDWFNYQLKQIDELRKKLGKGKLTDKQIESGKLPTYNFYDNKEEYKKYYNKARKHSRDLFDAKDKLIKEIERRDKLINPDIISNGKSNEELSALLDDFNYAINMITFSSPHFLSDININFNKTVTFKDKSKKNNLLRNTTIGLGSAALVGGSIYAAIKSKKIKPTIAKEVNSPVHNSSIAIPEIKKYSNPTINKSVKVSNGYSGKIANINRKVRNVKTAKVRKSSELEKLGNTNLIKKHLNNPNHEWKFSANFSRNKGSKDRVKRMTKLGAYTRLGIATGIGGLIGGLIGGKKGALISGGLLGGASYLEHKNSKYSPIGKKKWKNYITDNPTYYGIPLNKLPRLTK